MTMKIFRSYQLRIAAAELEVARLKRELAEQKYFSGSLSEQDYMEVQTMYLAASANYRDISYSTRPI